MENGWRKEAGLRASPVGEGGRTKKNNNMASPKAKAKHRERADEEGKVAGKGSEKVL